MEGTADSFLGRTQSFHWMPLLRGMYGPEEFFGWDGDANFAPERPRLDEREPEWMPHRDKECVIPISDWELEAPSIGDLSSDVGTPTVAERKRGSRSGRVHRPFHTGGSIYDIYIRDHGIDIYTRRIGSLLITGQSIPFDVGGEFTIDVNPAGVNAAKLHRLSCENLLQHEWFHNLVEMLSYYVETFSMSFAIRPISSTTSRRTPARTASRSRSPTRTSHGANGVNDCSMSAVRTTWRFHHRRGGA